MRMVLMITVMICSFVASRKCACTSKLGQSTHDRMVGKGRSHASSNQSKTNNKLDGMFNAAAAAAVVVVVVVVVKFKVVDSLHRCGGPIAFACLLRIDLLSSCVGFSLSK